MSTAPPAPGSDDPNFELALSDQGGVGSRSTPARRTVIAWLALNVVVIVLYTVVPPLFFNDGKSNIAGMPQILFWFTVMPFVVPALIAALYFYDRSIIRRWRAFGSGVEGSVQR